MGAVAVQGAIGEIGEKALTKLTNYGYNSLAMICGFAVGVNANGLYLLNVGETDDGEAFPRTITFASTDFGISNPKHLKYIEFGIQIESSFTVSVLTADGEWREYESEPPYEGLTRVRVPIGSKGIGKYWTVKFEASSFFRMDDVEVAMYVTSGGKRGV